MQINRGMTKGERHEAEKTKQKSQKNRDGVRFSGLRLELRLQSLSILFSVLSSFCVMSFLPYVVQPGLRTNNI